MKKFILLSILFFVSSVSFAKVKVWLKTDTGYSYFDSAYSLNEPMAEFNTTTKEMKIYFYSPMNTSVIVDDADINLGIRNCEEKISLYISENLVKEKYQKNFFTLVNDDSLSKTYIEKRIDDYNSIMKSFEKFGLDEIEICCKPISNKRLHYVRVGDNKIKGYISFKFFDVFTAKFHEKMLKENNLYLSVDGFKNIELNGLIESL